MEDLKVFSCSNEADGFTKEVCDSLGIEIRKN
jgi:hypothetical protein